jgi:hypothetical protein
MLRVAFIAYLCLTTIFGPSLCCCNAQQLVAMVEGVKCCGKRAHKEFSVPERHEHCSHHRHAHQRHETLEARHNETTSDLPPAGHELPPAGDEHDKHNCPCGQHHAKLVATLTNVVHGNGGDLQSQMRFVLAIQMPALPEFDGPLAVFSAARPAHLYGREMLRAYQIMRC